MEPDYRDNFLKDKNLPKVSLTLTAVNVIVFFISTFVGDKMYDAGSLSLLKVMGDGEVYRLITCMFLHGGIEHLVSNMLILYFLGEMLEKAIGPWKYLILYFGAGIGSGLASMGYEYLTNRIIFSVGASGAIYGIIGAMLFLVIVHKGRFGTITLPRMIFAIFYMLYSGMRNISVNNAAHIGGLCFGFIIIYIMYMMDSRKS